MRLIAIVLMTLLFSCKASENKNIAVSQQKVEMGSEKTSEIVFKEIKSGQNSDFIHLENIIITTQKEMDLNWMKMFGKHPRNPPIPMIDFETKQLLLATSGEQPNGGYTIKVKSIIQTAKGIIITIEDAKLGKTCNTTSALVYPFQLIEMPKTEGEIIFARESKIKPCK